MLLYYSMLLNSNYKSTKKDNIMKTLNVHNSINFKVGFNQSIQKFFSLVVDPTNTMTKTECYHLYVSRFPTFN